MLANRFSLAQIESSLLPHDAWSPFPTIADRATWDALNQHPLRIEQRKQIVKKAEEFATQPIAPITATMYLQYNRTGNRNIIDSSSFKRRNILGTLAVAECFEDGGRFLDPFIDMAWAITEEATWSVSAHVARVPDSGGALPRQDRHTVDLFACETACVLAEALYVMRPRLTSEVAALVDRIEREVLTRIVDEFMKYDDWWWLSGRNNWTPWCLSNIVGAAMYTVRDRAKLAAILHKSMTVMDRFISHYSDDGGCDEGPGYWNVSPGAMFIYLEFLHSRSNGALAIYHEPKLRKMASFAIDAHLDANWVINFADASAGLAVRPGVLERVGQRLNDNRFAQFVRAWRRGFKRGGPIVNALCGWPTGASLTHYLRDFFWAGHDAADVAPGKNLTSWYPLTQIVIARQSTEAEKGLVFAGKGGHNAENHNHNDVGQFILWIDGKPGIVDAGVEGYTRKTFSDERYTIWCIRASGHNPPLVGNFEQPAGATYRASDVTFDDAPQRSTFRASIHEAYPKDAGLARLTRTMTLDRETETFTVTDDFAFIDRTLPLRVLLWSPNLPTIERDGTVTIPAGPRGLVLSVSANLAVTIEPMSLAESTLKNTWGPQLYGIVLRHSPTSKSGFYSMQFKPRAG